MKVQAKNYVAHILKLVEGPGSRMVGAHPDTKDRVVRAARVLQGAVHFSLPPDGKVLESRTPIAAGMSGPLRLPYKAITMEFDLPISPEELQDLSDSLEPFDKVVIFAFEVPREFEGKEYHQAHFMVWIHKIDRNRRGIGWGVLNTVVALPFEWEEIQTEGENYRVPLFCTPVYGEGVGTLRELGELDELTSRWFGWYTGTLIDFLAALACSNVSHEVIQVADPSVNARRLRKGKLPLLETRCLTITVPGNKTYRVEDSDGDGDHDRNSPRQHLRRGHIRRLSDDRRIWVNSCIVGDPSKGRIDKSYKVRSAA